MRATSPQPNRQARLAAAAAVETKQEQGRGQEHTRRGFKIDPRNLSSVCVCLVVDRLLLTLRNQQTIVGQVKGARVTYGLALLAAHADWPRSIALAGVKPPINGRTDTHDGRATRPNSMALVLILALQGSAI